MKKIQFKKLPFILLIIGILIVGTVIGSFIFGKENDNNICSLNQLESKIQNFYNVGTYGHGDANTCQINMKLDNSWTCFVTNAEANPTSCNNGVCYSYNLNCRCFKSQ